MVSISSVRVWSAEHDATPDAPSAQVKLTVTGPLCQPLAFAAGDTLAVIDGADRIDLDRGGVGGLDVAGHIDRPVLTVCVPSPDTTAVVPAWVAPPSIL